MLIEIEKKSQTYRFEAAEGGKDTLRRLTSRGAFAI